MNDELIPCTTVELERLKIFLQARSRLNHAVGHTARVDHTKKNYGGPFVEAEPLEKINERRRYYGYDER